MQSSRNWPARRLANWRHLLPIAFAGALLAALVRPPGGQQVESHVAARHSVEKQSEQPPIEGERGSTHPSQVSTVEHPGPSNSGPAEQLAVLPLSGDTGSLKFRDAPVCHQEAITEWVETDPQAAADWALSLPESPERKEALQQVTIGWANADLAGAMTWLASLTNEPQKAGLVLAMGYEAARSHPEEALEIVGDLEPSTERDEALAHALSQWTQADAPGAAAWALRVPDPDLKDRLVSAAAIACAEKNGPGAALLASQGLTSPEEQERTSVSIVQRWAQTDPHGASEWVTAFPDGPSRSAAVENLYAIWASQDRSAAERHISQLPAALREIASAAIRQASGSAAEQP